MRIAGVDIAPAAMANLAARLDRAGHTDLAHRVGIAVDTDHPVRLRNGDRSMMLSVLAPCPPALELLRDTLRG